MKDDPRYDRYGRRCRWCGHMKEDHPGGVLKARTYDRTIPPPIACPKWEPQALIEGVL